MRFGRILIVGLCVMLAGTRVAVAQSGLADTVLSGFRLWMDSIDMPSHLRWNASCLGNSASSHSPAASCVVSDVPALSPRLFPDPARVMPLQHLGLPFARLGSPLMDEHVDRVDSIGVIVGGWHGSIEAHHLPVWRDVVFTLAPEDAGAVRPASLTLRCLKGVLDASLDGQQSLGRVHARAVTVRFGSETPDRQIWLRGADRTTLIFPGKQARVRAFLDELGDHNRLTIEVAPSRVAPPSVFTFNLAGVPVVVTQLENACK